MCLFECNRVEKRTKFRKLEPPGTIIKPPYLHLWFLGLGFLIIAIALTVAWYEYKKSTKNIRFYFIDISEKIY